MWTKGKRRRVLLAGLLGLMLLSAGTGVLAWRRYSSIPPPPRVDLSGAEPPVAQEIQAAYEKVRADPRSGPAWGRLGMVLLNANFNAQGFSCLLQAEQLDPREPRWPYVLGVRLLQSNPEQAVAQLQQAVDLCGSQPDAPRLQLAEALLLQEHLDQAEAQFRQLLPQDPGHARAHLGLARIAFERGRLSEALAMLQPAEQSRFTRKAALLLAAQIHERQGEHAAAGEALARAAELPKDAQWPDPFLDELAALDRSRLSYTERVEALHAEGRDQEADELMAQAEEDYPDLHWINEGRRHFEEGQFAAAEQELREATALAPNWFRAQFLLGVTLSAEKKFPEAITCLRKVAQLEPAHGPAYQALGYCEEQEGNLPAALEDYRQAVRYMPESARAQRNLGEILARLGQPAEALVHLRSAVQLDPKDPAARKRLVEVERQTEGKGEQGVDTPRSPGQK